VILPQVLDGGVYSRPWTFQLQFKHSHTVMFWIKFLLLAMHWMLMTLDQGKQFTWEKIASECNVTFEQYHNYECVHTYISMYVGFLIKLCKKTTYICTYSNISLMTDTHFTKWSGETKHFSKVQVMINAICVSVHLMFISHVNLSKSHLCILFASCTFF